MRGRRIYIFVLRFFFFFISAVFLRALKSSFLFLLLGNYFFFFYNQLRVHRVRQVLTVLIGEKTHTHTKGKNRLRPFSFLTFSLFTYGLVVIGTFMPHSLYQVHCSALVSDVAFIGFPFFFSFESYSLFFFSCLCVVVHARNISLLRFFFFLCKLLLHYPMHKLWYAKSNFSALHYNSR